MVECIGSMMTLGRRSERQKTPEVARHSHIQHVRLLYAKHIY